ncbi:MAG TPA: glycoside hydrolase family 15 protein [Longimicrobiaceae bacterium]|nr:glycoside hydrolase family 15 protein [Longimicrobiaceae bacterium]
MSESQTINEQAPGSAPPQTSGNYLPIESYGAIGNLRTVALVGLNGSIDWCCLPELDRPSVFGALLDDAKGGRFKVSPVSEFTSDQHYLHGTNVLRTEFEVAGGRVCMTDFMPLRGTIIGAGAPPTAPEIYRILECEEGEVEMEVEWSPRFDYARARTRIRRTPGGFLASAGRERLTLGGLPHSARHQDAPPAVIRSRFTIRAGEQVTLLTRYGGSDGHVDRAKCGAALKHTIDAWREWVHECHSSNICAFGGKWHDQIIRSGLTLKLLTHPDTGAIAAAATTSLPEEIGGVRNWDYRFSWIRDAGFSAQALMALGHKDEALDFLYWVERVAQASGEEDWRLQIMYGLHGETDLTEIILPHLEGYRGSRPVRIGNSAAHQRQLDIYGELLGAAYEFVRMGGELDADLASFLSIIADRACKAWTEPDAGIWEVRGGPRHFVYSKLMVWVALDRAISMYERFGLPGNVKRWQKNRALVRQAILENGYDDELGAFVQSYGSKHLDASNLLIPVVGFLPFDDPRVQGTIDRTLERLTKNGLVYRYRSDDGIPGGEGAFGLTTFWMVDALALSGRMDEAVEMFENVAARANHLGLFSEEFDPHTGAFLGNFPQAFTHIGFVNSALYLARAAGRQPEAPAPIGSREHRVETGHDAGAAV